VQASPAGRWRWLPYNDIAIESLQTSKYLQQTPAIISAAVTGDEISQRLLVGATKYPRNVPQVDLHTVKTVFTH